MTTALELRAKLSLDSRAQLILWGLQHEEAMEGAAVTVSLHPEDCGCDRAACRSLRMIAQSAAEALDGEAA